MTLEWEGSEKTLRLCEAQLPIFSFKVGFLTFFTLNMLVESVIQESHPKPHSETI